MSRAAIPDYGDSVGSVVYCAEYLAYSLDVNGVVDALLHTNGHEHHLRGNFISFFFFQLGE